jgi:ATP phosphoribosyltransferase regulatory subunit
MPALAQALKNEEHFMLALRELYRQHGYQRYKMSKFEEYDFYAENKSFLLCDNIITFTDLDGRLMALKPDVTLSIVKNVRDDGAVQKLYYDENVYRARPGDRAYREILQTGLECIGELDDYSVGEVVMLACRSLRELSPDYILDLSHLGYLSALLRKAGLPPESSEALLGLIRDKNEAAVGEYCAQRGVSALYSRRLARLAGAYGPFEEMITLLAEYSVDESTAQAVAELRGVYEHLKVCGCASGVNIDLSIVNDMRYYNGIIFQGFAAGVPAAVLSGGRYDRLLRKFGRRAGAVGFALYLDLLERLLRQDDPFDADVLLLYDEKTPSTAVAGAVQELTESGLSVLARRGETRGLRCRRTMRMTEGGARDIGDDA